MAKRQTKQEIDETGINIKKCVGIGREEQQQKKNQNDSSRGIENRRGLLSLSLTRHKLVGEDNQTRGEAI